MTDLSATSSAATPHTGAPAVLRAVALALLCGVLQWGVPQYTLGSTTLAPLSIALGVAVAAAMSRGRWTVPAALVGVLSL